MKTMIFIICFNLIHHIASNNYEIVNELIIAIQLQLRVPVQIFNQPIIDYRKYENSQRVLARKLSSLKILYSNINKNEIFKLKSKQKILWVVYIDTMKSLEQFQPKYLTNECWLMISWRSDYSTLLNNELKSLSIPFNSRVLLATISESIFLIHEIWEIKPHSSKTTRLWGKWSFKDGWLLLPKNGFLNIIREDMSTVLLRGIVFDDTPIVNVVKQNGDWKLEGYLGEVINLLEESLNMSIHLTKNNSLKWGTKHKNVWNGCVGELIAGRYDISIGYYVMTGSRAKVINYLAQILLSPLQIYIKNAKTQNSINWTSIFDPFDYILWIGILSLSLISIILYHIYLICREYQIQSMQFSIIVEYCLSLFSFLFLQGGMKQLPIYDSGKIIIFIIGLFAVVIYNSYGANLIAFTTLSEFVPPFKNIEGMLRMNTHRTILVANSSSYDLIRENGEKMKVFKKIFKEHLYPYRYSLPTSYKSLLDAVCDGGGSVEFGAFAREDIVNQLRPTLSCPVIPLVEKIQLSAIAWIASKNIPYDSIINYRIIQFQNGGILNRNHEILKRYYLNKREDFKYEQSQFEMVSIQSILIIFLLLLIGIIISLLILIIELLIQNKKEYEGNYKKKFLK